MMLAIDVGNTHIVVALYGDEKLENSWRMSTDRNKSSDELGMVIVQFLTHNKTDLDEINSVIISSVVPPIMHSLCSAVKKYLKCDPIIVGPGIKTGLNIRYDNPKEVGADRIVNAVAAIEKYGYPLIIVDFGTANTYCAIDKDGNYLGGVITAGVQISLDALFERAAKLPKVEIVAPECTIGKNTVNAMQAGAVYGQAGQVDRIVENMKKEINAPKCNVVATGGLSSLIAPYSEQINIVDKNLTLDGLKLIYDRNKE